MHWLLGLVLPILFVGPLWGQTTKTDQLRQQLAQAQGDSLRAWTHVALCSHLSDVDPSAALAHCDSAEQMVSRVEHPDLLRVQILSGRCNAYSWLADYLTSTQLGVDGAQLAMELGDTLAYIDFITTIGINDYLREDWSKAEERFREMLAMAEAVQDKQRTALAWNNLGLIYSEQGLTTKELEAYQRALAMFEGWGSDWDLATVRLNLGTAYIELEDYAAAQAELWPALALFQRSQVSSGEAETWLGLAAVAKADGNDPQALAYADSALAITEREGFSDLRMNVLETRQDLFARLGHYEKAYRAARELADVTKKVFSQEKEQQLNDLSVQYETQRKEQEITQLQQARELDALRLKRSRQERLMLVAGGVGVLAVAVVLLLLYRARQRTARQLAAANATKDRLFTILAHDLNNPLAAFRTIADSLEQHGHQLSTDQHRELLQAMSKQARELQLLLGNLLDWSLNEQGQLQVNPEPVQLKDLVGQLQQLYANSLKAKGLELKVMLDTDLTVNIDPKITFGILRNLMGNAIKFSPEAGTIEVRAQAGEQAVVLEICDHGLGMDEAQLASVNLGQRQPSRQGTAGETGTGLGTQLVKELANTHRLPIRWTRGQQHGTTVTLEIPLVYEN